MASKPVDKASEEDKANILPSDELSIDLPGSKSDKPANLRHISEPAYESPLRHHKREHSNPRAVKETLHARSEYTNSEDDGGAAVHRINQYVIKEEIGRGSFGAVHLAVDQFGTEYAVKEFSKSRLRRRIRSNILRRPHAARRKGAIAAGLGFNAPLSRQSTSEIDDSATQDNPLLLIKEEIAIMKKLNHGNLVSLIEVLDDPREDSLYMVLEMCKKGVIMKVGVDEKADPYDEESCRCWFRDLILGIEYLHAQGVIHRDIKPDNLLLTEDDVLKIVDFGVSEMFEKQSEMLTAKSAGSPAFLPPELCVAKHGDVSGKAADIWSMGITLYCLMFGQLPFQNTGVLQLYEAIQKDDVDMNSHSGSDASFKDLMFRILEKDPSKRIKMEELRDHPWVTKDGNDPLLSVEENTANLVEPPTQEETDQAITGNLSNILVLMKAVKKFKKIISSKRPLGMVGILGNDTRIVQPPSAMDVRNPDKPPLVHKSRSVDIEDRRAVEGALVAEGVHRDVPLDSKHGQIEHRDDSAIASVAKRPTWASNEKSDKRDSASPTGLKRDLDADPKIHRIAHAATFPQVAHHHQGKGQAHDPLEDHLYLNLGPGSSSRPPSPPAVSESPPATDIDVYETAYRRELEKLRASQGRSTTLFLTRRVDKMESTLRDYGLILEDGRSPSLSHSGLSKIIDAARSSAKKDVEDANSDAQKQADADDSEQPTGGATKSNAGGIGGKLAAIGGSALQNLVAQAQEAASKGAGSEPDASK